MSFSSYLQKRERYHFQASALFQKKSEAFLLLAKSVYFSFEIISQQAILENFQLRTRDTDSHRKIGARRKMAILYVCPTREIFLCISNKTPERHVC
ncbi:hypothetical protein TNIN_322511 [Trichonephila inaurata madagascariensis]|uniref:Uncharacterized protein n=1 Tax=Trichonephila inaurata madagascariensis TaxID=2747483 RepID=A0A8X7C6Y9_9ARAC|nr:hypothetical protein TNIN_322511 [Trichonephila inaurata madagascariensis]